MIFICYIWSNFIISLIVDTNWWKNFGLSLLGSVGVPLTIWLLTRYYGADKAEERKELKELRNNLNLMLSLLYSNIEKMSILREHLLCVIDIERRNNIIYPNELNMIFSNLIAENYFEIIDITKYASCIAYDKDFVFNLVQLKNIMQIIHKKIVAKNKWVEKLGPLDELSKNTKAILHTIKQDYEGNVIFLYEIDNLILKCQKMVEKIENLPNNIKNLKLNSLYTLPVFFDFFSVSAYSAIWSSKSEMRSFISERSN